MQNAKILTLSDDAVLADLIGRGGSKRKNNFIVVRDQETNVILQTRKNLVVRKGREFNLRKMFNLPYASESQTNLDTRFINCFGIGSGGTPIADPFNPIAPTPADTALNKEVPYRILTNGQVLPTNVASQYTDARTISGGTHYFKKTFAEKRIVTDTTTDDYYVKLTLEITEADARGTFISELGLFTSRFVNNQYVDFQLATRVTFQTEPLSVETNKGLVIDYYVYA